MASDQQIAEGLQSLFRETNPNSFNSLNQVVLHLQSKLGFDLSNKIDFIRAQINLLFSPPPPPPPPPHPHPQHQHQPLLNPNPNPNPIAVPVHNPNCLPNQGYGSPHARQHVFGSQSYFARGPTEINFANPSGGTVRVDSVVTPPAKDSGQKPKRRGGSGGLNKLCGVTPELQAIVGQPALPRTEIVRQLWAYIRKNNLQDPSNKRKIICNDELRLVFEVDCTDMFQMNKLLSKHILPLNPTNDPGHQSKKLKVDESQVPSSEVTAPVVIPETPASSSVTTEIKMPQSDVYKSVEESEKLKSEESQVPSSETSTPIVISEALAKFFGTSEMKMAQSDVYTRIDEYIKTQGLEDPLNSMIRCDSKLQELLGCESINASAILDTLSRNHLSQQV